MKPYRNKKLPKGFDKDDARCTGGQSKHGVRMKPEIKAAMRRSLKRSDKAKDSRGLDFL